MSAVRKLISIEKMCLELMLEDEEVRADDFLLWMRVATRFYGFNPNTPTITLVKHFSEMDLPAFKSVERVRRKIQEMYPGLRAKGACEDARISMQADFIEYAKSR